MYREIRIKIGKNLKYIRENKGISINKLSVLCKVSASTISKIENTTYNFRLYQLEKIITALEININDIF